MTTGRSVMSRSRDGLWSLSPTVSGKKYQTFSRICDYGHAIVVVHFGKMYARLDFFFEYTKVFEYTKDQKFER
jgi:hypothetical protein